MTRPCGRPPLPPGYVPVTFSLAGYVRRVYLPAAVKAGLDATAAGEGRARAATLRGALVHHYRRAGATAETETDRAIRLEGAERRESWSAIVRRVLSPRFGPMPPAASSDRKSWAARGGGGREEGVSRRYGGGRK